MQYLCGGSDSPVSGGPLMVLINSNRTCIKVEKEDTQASRILLPQTGAVSPSLSHSLSFWVPQNRSLSKTEEKISRNIK
jgi:hypothetical protein